MPARQRGDDVCIVCIRNSPERKYVCVAHDEASLVESAEEIEIKKSHAIEPRVVIVNSSASRFRFGTRAGRQVAKRAGGDEASCTVACILACAFIGVVMLRWGDEKLRRVTYISPSPRTRFVFSSEALYCSPNYTISHDSRATCQAENKIIAQRASACCILFSAGFRLQVALISRE